MGNSRILQKATKELTKAKAPKKSKDIIYDPAGQWKFPGQNTRIPGGDITMQGVPYPVYAQPNVGQPQMMYPGQEYMFPEADYVDEYPQMKRGGYMKGLVPMPKPSKKGLASKAYSRSLDATNRLFTENNLFKKPKDKKRKVFDPNAKYYASGGEYGMPLGTGVSQNFIGNRDNFNVGGIPNLPLRDNRVNYNAFVNGFDPMTKKQNGGDVNDFIELDLTPEEIQAYKDGGYVVEDISVPEINQYAKGGGKKKKKETAKEQEPGIVSKTPFQPGTYDPNEMAGSMVNLSAATKSEKAPMWVGFANDYEKKNSRQAFIDGKKRDYLKQNKGLNTAAGVNMDNFPEKVAQNFANEYDYKKNNYVTKRLGKEKNFNPRNRGEWVDELSPGERKAVENSRYGSKLQASAWDRSLAGLKKIGSYASSDIGKMNIEGLTKAEQAEIQNSKLGALETLAVGDIPGMAIANFAKNRGLSTGSNYKQLPGGLSGNKMANVSDADAMALNPLTYAGLEALPQLGMNAARIGVKALKAGYKGTKAGVKSLKAIPKIAASADNVGNVAKTEDDLVDLWRIQEKGARPMSELAAEGKLGPMFKNEKAIKHFKDREEHFGQWFTKDKADLDWYKKDREFADPEILNLKVPKSKLNNYSNYNKSLSSAPDREFVVPHNEQSLYKINKNTSGTLNAGISPELLKNAVGPSNKVGANLLDQAYVSPSMGILNKTLNKISPLNYVPGYGKKLEGAVKPLGNVINKNIKNGNLVEQQGIIGKAKNVIGKGQADPITTKMNRTNTDIYAAKFDDAVDNSDIVLGDPMRQGFMGRTFNKKNALTPLQSKTTGNPLTEVSLLDEGVSLNRRLPFSNRYVDINKQKLLNNEFQWSTTGAGLQNVAEKFGKAIPVVGGAGAATAALTYDPYSDMDDEAKQFIKKNNITVEDLRKKGYSIPTRMQATKEGFLNSITAPTDFLSRPDPYYSKTILDATGYAKGGDVNNFIELDLTPEEIDEYKKGGWVIEYVD